MYYINQAADTSGNHGNPVSHQTEGMVALPESLLSEYIHTMGFAYLTVDEGTVTAVAINQEAYDAYIDDHPVTPEPEPPKTIEDLEHENVLLRAQVQAMSDRNDFIEDCIAEMAEIVYA